MNRSTLAWILFVVASFTVAVAAQQAVGRVAQSWGDVRGTPQSGTASALAAGDDLFLGHLIETGSASGARMTLGANGVVRVGPESALRIDQAVIDQATGREQNLWSLLVGKIEVALGRLFRGDVTIDTPSAELGVKGTVFRVLVDLAGNTFVAVLEGTVEVRSKASDSLVLLETGTWTRIDVGADPLPPRGFEAGTTTLSPTTGGPDFTVPGEETTGDPPINDGDFEINPPRLPPDSQPRRGDDPP